MSDKPRRDHLWVLVIIALCVLAEVWPSWVGIGAIAGFPRLGHIPTDWVLAVAMEAYWAYTLWAWLAASPGRRSRAWAMWSCAVVFAFSLTCQVLDHELTVAPGTPLGRRFVVGFVTSLPVVVLALIAVLIHLRHADREEAAEVAEESALRSELSEAAAARSAAVTAQADAEKREQEALRQNEILTRKLEAATHKASAPKGRSRKRASTQAEDLTTELRAVQLLEADPALRQPRMGGELARRLGVSPATGRRLHSQLTARTGDGEPLTERSPDGPDARSDERS